eukprot:753684-Hanusia_phi.AAC.4
MHRLLHDDPLLIRRTHVAFYMAGSDIALSASYQGTVAGFVQAGHDAEEGARLLQSSVRLIREARDEAWNRMQEDGTSGRRMRPFAGASLGCYGASLANGAEYTGVYDIERDQLRDFHLERTKLLAGEGPDVLVFETSERTWRRGQ